MSPELLEDRRLLSGVAGAQVDFGQESAFVASQGEVSAPVLGSFHQSSPALQTATVSQGLNAAHDAALEAILDDVVGPTQTGNLAAKATSVAEGESQFFVSPGFRPDVTGDGCVTPSDALVGINRINGMGIGPVTQEFAAPFYDVNLDGEHTPVDILIVINWINTNGNTCNSPVANTMNVTSHGGKISVGAPGLLSNVGGVPPLTAELVSPPSHGTITLRPDGSFDYDTNWGYSGPESFTYRILSADGQVAIGKVDFVVTSPTRPPVAGADTYFVEPGQMLVPPAGVLANDLDPDLFDLRAQVQESPQHGTLRFNPDGTFIYESVGDYQGEDGFTYVAGNSGFSSSPATPVSITVGPNQGPTGPAMQTATVLEGQTISVDAHNGLLRGFVDREGDLPLTAQMVAPFSTDGTFTVNADGSWSFTPNQDFQDGTTMVSYVGVDANGHPSAPSQLQIIVTPNRPPEGGQNQTATVLEKSKITVQAPGLLTGFTDPEGEQFHPVVVTPSSDGEFTLGTDGSWEFTPNDDFVGMTTVQYAALDSAGKQSETKTLTIIVTPNQAPTGLTDHAYQIAERHTLNVSAAQGLLAGVTNPEPGESFHPVITAPPFNATITLNPDGSFACTPVDDAKPGDQVVFMYAVLDAAGKQSESKTVTVTLTPNHIPTASDIVTSVEEDNALTVDVLPAANDLDGDPLVVSTITDVRNGFAQIVGSTILFYPDVNFAGQAQMTYTVSDGTGTSNPATVYINVTPVADGEGEADTLAVAGIADKKTFDASVDAIMGSELDRADLLA